MWSYLTQFSLEWETFQKKNVDKKTHFIFNNFFVLKSLRLCEIMWKNIVEMGRSQMRIWRMRIARWVANASETPERYNTYCFASATMVAPPRQMLHYTYLTCLVSTVISHTYFFLYWILFYVITLPLPFAFFLHVFLIAFYNSCLSIVYF